MRSAPAAGLACVLAITMAVAKTALGAPAATCVNGAKDGLETDVDCGGQSACKCLPGTPWFGCAEFLCLDRACPPCATGRACRKAVDCESRKCRPRSRFLCVVAGYCAGVCLEPTCDDGVANGNEADVDCGGSCPRKCDPGDTCGTDADCASNVCAGDECRPARCDDGVQNGGETGVDCGGSCASCSCRTRGQCIMFVTSTSTDGGLGGLRGADQLCGERARAAGLAGTFQAWLCDGTNSPATRSMRADVPYVRTDGAVIARNWTDLTDGSILHPINVTELGKSVYFTAPYLPWTYVRADGTCDDQKYLSPGTGPCPIFQWCKMDCADPSTAGGWTSGSRMAQGAKGDINRTDYGWTDGVSGLCSDPFERIYCIEQ